MTTAFTVCVVGNPNCGKTTLFNALTGSRQQVGNWPGVTVEKKTGAYRHRGRLINLVDLPGTYSLEADDDSVSLDEKLARDYVAAREADLVVNILDASNIERNLYLTTQLIEMRAPMLVVLNMMDMVRKRGVRIDVDALSARLQCPVLPISASGKLGLGELKDAINQACASRPRPMLNVPYHPAVERAAARMLAEIERADCADVCDRRWLALRLLENDTLAKQLAGPALTALAVELRRTAESEAGDEIDILAADARYGLVREWAQAAVCRLNEASQTSTERIDRVVLNRYLGIPVFFMVMYAMFMCTINFGNVFVDFFDQAAAALLVEAPGVWLRAQGAPEWLSVLLCGGAGGGLQVVAMFIPIVGFLFVFLSLLEDSGYMARAAFVMDRCMCMLGLPGKSFVPMIIGFGCNVPAIIATRTLDNPRDRILTNMMNPFMSCGARLPVYALFAAAFFPVGGQNLVFGLYLFGIFAAVITGLVMRHTLLKGEPTPFVMELPAYHFPTLRGVCIKTWERLRGFIFNAGRLIVPMVMVLNTLNSWGVNGEFGQENSGHSVLSEIGRRLTPAFEPMGVRPDNWPATVGVFTGVLAKEAVVGTLGSLYAQLARPEPSAKAEREFDLPDALLAASRTIPDNLQAMADKWLDPLGLDLSHYNAAAATDSARQETYRVMQSHFDGQAGAFAYLVFILLYAPCVAATAAIMRETSPGWAAFVSVWTSFIAYSAATLFYQALTFSRHPAATLGWCLGLTALFAAVVIGLRVLGQRQELRL